MEHRTKRLILPIALTISVSACGPSSSERKPDAADDAYTVCTAMMNTNLVSKCDVNGWNSSVDVRIDTTGEEAIKICTGSVAQISQYTARLAGKWKLRVFSPFSGDNVLAECPF